MASPSHFEKTHEDYNRPSGEEQAKDKDWLELGLGFSIACRKEEEEEEEEHQRNAVSASPSSQLQQVKQKPTGCGAGLELGLSLGRDLESMPGLELDHEHGVRVIGMAPPGNYDQGSWQNQDEDHCDEDYDDMAWWPCDMNSGSFLGLDDWQMPVPNTSHDYLAGTRPHSGLWFTLQSYTNRRNGEALPQIPKAYIRVKDENVTIFMVKKYLVTKLGLSNEAEVDISCMGQKLLHTLTLKQVRDCVWLPRLVESVNPTTVSFENYSHQSCVNDHLMSLQYGRRCALN
ncbi:PREDICTED: uncharacterized protein LOC18612903 isoform X1 [Theobroma cacao]|uniref:Uncharacterized protein LOC18612903 isoform X1 n=1 Tax=Theobroma cacao TaxID=3641 RepID=A0AB32VZI6_THECC|nr:PREDICTED: uncharacterized protein LOC18612903 isoform X1 [Theobroma cacao]